MLDLSKPGMELVLVVRGCDLDTIHADKVPCFTSACHLHVNASRQFSKMRTRGKVCNIISYIRWVSQISKVRLTIRRSNLRTAAACTVQIIHATIASSKQDDRYPRNWRMRISMGPLKHLQYMSWMRLGTHW